MDIKKIFPWFVLLFLLASVITTVLPIPTSVTAFLKEASKFFIVMAMAAIGLNTRFSDMKSAGIRPMIHGFLISALVVIVAITVEWWMGLV